ncbi:cysteine desulfurase family protein [Microbacterium marinilacus]|uniref:cysteine desulfurase n=1 Tax=Microbacterium marinilacus TaxID=415209 RepID=A0ABP7B8U5_9MICO|nr:cysteine desulfurase family protein [Microbacterium marinilacus]MBY0687473.1 cysteine desulfurase [Microbacterium marinilacus]
MRYLDALYLDNAATAPVRREVLEAMAPHLTTEFGNPSSRHGAGERAANALEDARSRVAAVVGMRRGDIVFTSGGTEANNLAVKGVAVAAMLERRRRDHVRHPPASAGHIVITSIEHESVLRSAAHLEAVHGIEVGVVPVDRHGLVDPADVGETIRDDTELVSVAYANNEVGTVQDLVGIRAAIGRIPLHTDAVQAAGWLPLSGLPVDALTIAGHKIGAPKGTGALAVRGRVPIEPLLHGGGQERGRRSGTESVAGAVALATALELAESERVANAERVGALRDELITRVLALVPSARLTGHPTRRLPGTASFTFAGADGPGTSGEAVLLELERRGVLSSSGSACAAGSSDPSHVLLGMGVSADAAQTALRISLAHDHRTRLVDVAEAVAASVAAVHR